MRGNETHPETVGTAVVVTVLVVVVVVVVVAVLEQIRQWTYKSVEWYFGCVGLNTRAKRRDHSLRFD
jgi:hypothetical protein